MQEIETLLDLMSQPSALCNIVTAGFENNVPARYKVQIIQVGATFNYDDTSSEIVGPKNVNIGYGGQELLMTTCTDKCCTQIFGAMNVQQQGHPPKTITETRNSEPDSCTLAERFVLVIKSQVTKDELAAFTATGDISPLLQLTIR